MASRQDIPFHIRCTRTLEGLGIPYAIIGGFAGVSYGVNRVTYDLDVVIDPTKIQVEAIAAAFPGPRYHADVSEMLKLSQAGRIFSILDIERFEKIDFIPLSMDAVYGYALQNRIQRSILIDDEIDEQIWIARPEDVIVGKLMVWNVDGVFKHECDIRDILTVLKMGLEPRLQETFDLEYITMWAHQIGNDTVRLWEHIVEIVDSDEIAQTN